MASRSNLRYFTSVRISKENADSFKDLEDLLQQEHLANGTHPVGSENTGGFITPTLVRKINLLWDFMQKQQNASTK